MLSLLFVFFEKLQSHVGIFLVFMFVTVFFIFCYVMCVNDKLNHLQHENVKTTTFTTHKIIKNNQTDKLKQQ